MVIYSGFTHLKWWFSIVMWLFTRGYPKFDAWSSCSPEKKAKFEAQPHFQHGPSCFLSFSWFTSRVNAHTVDTQNPFKKKIHHIIHHTTYSKKNHWHHYTSLTLSLGWRVNLHSWLQLAWSSRPVMILQVSPSKSMVDPQRSKQSSFWKLIQNPIKILCLWYLNGLFNQPQL